LLLLTSANSTVQTAAHDTLRGRVMSVYLLVFVGGAAIGGPLLGAADEHFGPRIGMLLSGAVPAIAVVFIAAKLASDARRGATLTGGPMAQLAAVMAR
jgi:MFS family permease